MSEPKWTAGPWEYSPRESRVDESGTGDMLAFVQSTEKSSREDIANAHLIAAAPELYEALKAFCAWMAADASSPDYHGLTRDTHPEGEAIWRAWWNANLALCAKASKLGPAALAKARGEQ